MALGKVEFGHGGFSERNQKFSMKKKRFSENVGNNRGFKEEVEMCIKGWINSAGHKKNMLADHNICAIGVYVHK